MKSPNKTRILIATAAGAALVLTGLSACGKMGHLEQAPPMYGKDAKSSWSASQTSGGGNEATNSTSASKETERALPDANGPNNSPLNKPGQGKGQLEGFGNATGTHY
jgi:hypothetical protein